MAIKVLEHSYVFVVMEHARRVNEYSNDAKDAAVHGVYTTRQIAVNKAVSVINKNRKKGVNTGYLTIRKMSIQGPCMTRENIWAFD